MHLIASRRPSAAQIASLVAAGLGLAGLLFFGSLKLFGDGRIPGVISRREVLDGLSAAAMALPAGLFLFLRPRAARTTAPRRGRLDWRWVIVLGLLILLAAGLRFYKLDYQSLWRDEIASVARVESVSLPVALSLGNWQDAWPSYHIPVYLFVRLAGDSEFAFRILSALAGVLLIPMLFVLGRRMFSTREGLIAAGLAVALKAPLWYSQEMRSYSFLMLYAALSAYFYLRLAQEYVYRRAPSRFALAGFVASAILTMYAHYFGLVLVAVEGLGALVLVLHLRRIPLTLLAAFAGIGLAYMPWIPLLLFDLGKGDFWPNKPDWFGGSLFGFLSFVFRSPLVFVALALGAIGIVIVLWRSYRQGGEGKALPLAVTPGVVLVAWLILPYALAYWRSVESAPILVNRYLLISLPPAYLLLSRAITRLPVGKAWQGVLAAGIIGAVVIHVVTGNYYVKPNRTQLRETVAYITSHDAQYPDSMVIAGYQGGQRELDYYFEKFGSAHTIDIKAGNAWQVDDVRAQLAERQPRYIWFIGQYLFYEKEFEDSLSHDYRLIGKQDFYHITLYLYENPAGK